MLNGTFEFSMTPLHSKRSHSYYTTEFLIGSSLVANLAILVGGFVGTCPTDSAERSGLGT